MNTLQAISMRRMQLYQRWKPAAQQHIGWLVMAAIILVALANYLFQPSKISDNKVKGVVISTAASSSAKPVAISTIKVDVSGAVNQPGVKVLRVGDRVEDAIKAAGGFTNQADSNYVAISVNMAQKAQDGDKIFIPAKDQFTDQMANSQTIATSKSIPTNVPTAAGGKVSLNHASASELDTLPGIGSTYAQRIISSRPYTSIDELCSKNIFRSKTTCDKIRPFVTL